MTIKTSTINTVVLLVGLFTLSTFKSESQPPPPPNIVIAGQPDTAGNPTIVVSGKVVSIPPVPTAVSTTTAPAITGGSCAAPGATPPSYAIYAQDPTTKTCLPVIIVPDSGFVANVGASITQWALYNPNDAPYTVIPVQLLSNIAGPYVVTGLTESSVIVCGVGISQCLNWTVQP